MGGLHKKIQKSEIDSCQEILKKRDRQLNDGNATVRKLPLSNDLYPEPFSIKLTHRQYYGLCEKAVATNQGRSNILRKCLDESLFGERNNSIQLTESEKDDLISSFNQFIHWAQEFISPGTSFEITKGTDGWKVVNTTKNPV